MEVPGMFFLRKASFEREPVRVMDFEEFAPVLYKNTVL